MRAFLILFTLLPFFTSAQDKINEDVLAAFNAQEQVSCMITMTEQLDLLGATEGLTKVEKAKFVFEALKKHAKENQAGLIDQLSLLGVDYKSFIIFNGVLAKLTRDQAETISLREDVASITMDQALMVSTTQEDFVAPRTEAEWGIQKIQADSVWALGYQGEGAIIAGQDTGYDFTNPLILNKYRGYSPDTLIHDYNWHDAIFEINPLHGDSIPEESLNPCGFLSPEPCDDHRHGTHTMGTMVGRDSTNFIGVAPQAKWIGCRNMERGYGKPSTYTECYEWFLAPTDMNGENADPSKAPHVINNSWNCPAMEGCNPDNWHIMETVVNNLTAAGTIVVVSAGNDGSQGCGSIYKASSFFDNAFTVGATDDDDDIASFSSIGPINIDSSGRLKPDIVAPGVQVRSITLNGFGTWNGTSMAGPHVAGVVALIINANPSLAGEVDIIKDIIRETAVPLTDTLFCDSLSAEVVPNFIYGYGRINALKAVEKAVALINTSDVDIVKDLVNVFPNPSYQFTNYVSWNKQKINKIELFDLNGSLIKSAEPGLPSYIMETTDLTQGLYVYKVYTNEGREAGLLKKARF